VMRQGPSHFLRRVRDMAQSFNGVSSATLMHDDRWHYLIAGRYFERALMTVRILGAMDVEREPWPELKRLLEICCASEPFVHYSMHTPDAADVFAFLILSADSPRSLRFALREIDEAMHAVSKSPINGYANDAERRLGRLRSFLDYSPVEELLSDGIDAFAAEWAAELDTLCVEIIRSYTPPLVAELTA